MKARAVLVVAGSALVAMVLAVAATTTSPRIVSGPPQIGGLGTAGRAGEQPAARRPQPTKPPKSSDRKAPRAVSLAFDALLLAACAAFVGLVIARAIPAWRDGRRLVWRREPAEWDDVEVHDAALDPVLARVAADAAAQRAALTRGSARNGIVECWMRLETVVADAGIGRRPSDTSTELTERVLADSAVDPVAIEQLSSLYREARFSTHGMGEAERTAAVTALDAVHAGLRVGVVNRDRVADSARTATTAS
ncbi:MAG: DUF4129 domain-containing protein [Acidimicrobiia bacterium]